MVAKFEIKGDKQVCNGTDAVIRVSPAPGSPFAISASSVVWNVTYDLEDDSLEQGRVINLWNNVRDVKSSIESSGTEVGNEVQATVSGYQVRKHGNYCPILRALRYLTLSPIFT